MGTDGFLLFGVVNSTQMLESLEIKQYCESDEVSEEAGDELNESTDSLAENFYSMPQQQMWPLRGGGTKGDQKLDKRNVICEKLLIGYITPFEKKQDRGHL